jgi:transketolase
MRNSFVEALCDAATASPDIWLLTADLGYSVLEPFAERFPERYLNVGIAEQNMMGVAAGLALSGKRVVVYSIVNFATLRCFEQIRNDIVYHNANVTIVGVGGGFAYGTQGYTHHGIEDISVMRSLGMIDVTAPADAVEAREIVKISLNRLGPTYVRLGKAGEPEVHMSKPDLQRGKIVSVCEGSEALIVATGGLVAEAVAAAGILANEGCSVAVWSVPWLQPFDEAAIKKSAQHYPLIVTAEEATESGGLGSAVASVIAGLDGQRASVMVAAVPGDAKHNVLGQESARVEFRLDADGLAARVRTSLARLAKQ